MKNITFTLLLVALTHFIANTQETQNIQSLSVESIWKQYQFFGQSVEGFRSMKDGEHYTRFKLFNGQKSIMKYAFKDINGEPTVLLDGKALVYNGKKLNVDGYEFNEDESKLLLTVNRKSRYRRSFFAEYFLYDLNTNTLAPLDSERKPQTLASYSPDGKKVAYIFENNLYIKDIASGKITALTKDGEQNKIINGTTDWVYEEEFAYVKAYEWSPSSEYLAYLRFDESEVKEYKLMTLTLNRHQNHLKYHWIDVLDKKMTSKVVYVERDEAYVEIDDDLYFLNDGKHFIRTSEKDGYNHIYKIGMDGSSQQISKGNWDVIEFKGVNEETSVLYYTSAEEGPQYSALYSIHLDGTNKDKISDNKGSNNVTFSQGMKYYVNNWSNINTPNVYSLHTADGDLLKLLETNEALKQRLIKYDFQPKQFITLKGAAEDLNGWILYPPHFDSTKQYPVYFNIYGGPGSNMVEDAYDGGNGAYHQLLSQKGYIVMSVDPRGTMYRGSKFKRSTYLQLGKLETEDIIAVAKNIKKWDFVDPDRIGIMGWSYGGYMASLAITKGAADFKMAIAVAPVTNWRYYDNIYTERFMRTPQENASGYDDNSPINYVNKLNGNYLIIHGGGDDNVHVQNAMEMITALVDADKDFDAFIYPNKNHGIYGGNTRNHLYRMMLEYTLKNL